MYDFRDIHQTTTDEQIRAWAVERAIDSFSPREGGAMDSQHLLERASAIEEFVKNGKAA